MDAVREHVLARPDLWRCLGPSGAGKSTLTNALSGDVVMFTRALRADGKGRHTTVHRELVVLPGGGLVVDTPGLRSVGLTDVSESLDLVFADVEELAGAVPVRRLRPRDRAGVRGAGRAGVRRAAGAALGELPQAAARGPAGWRCGTTRGCAPRSARGGSGSPRSTATGRQPAPDPAAALSAEACRCGSSAAPRGCRAPSRAPTPTRSTAQVRAVGDLESQPAGAEHPGEVPVREGQHRPVHGPRTSSITRSARAPTSAPTRRRAGRRARPSSRAVTPGSAPSSAPRRRRSPTREVVDQPPGAVPASSAVRRARSSGLDSTRANDVPAQLLRHRAARPRRRPRSGPGRCGWCAGRTRSTRSRRAAPASSCEAGRTVGRIMSARYPPGQNGRHDEPRGRRRRDRDGAGRRGGGRPAGPGRALRRRRRAGAGRRRVPVLGLRPEQDDDPRLDACSPRRGGPTPTPAAARSSRTSRPSPSGSATRPPTTGTTRSRSTGSRARAAGWSAARPGWTGRAGCASATTPSSPPRRRGRHRVGARRTPDRRAGRHAVLDQPRGDLGRPPRRSRSSCSAVARSASSWRRCSPASARAVTVVEAIDRLLPPEEPEAGEVVAAALRDDGVECAGREGGARGSRRTARRRRLEDGTSVAAPSCSSASGGGPGSASSASTPSGWTRAAQALEVDERMRAGERLWADRRRDRRRARSPTWRCTRRASRSRHPRPGAARRPTTRGLARVTFTDPEVGFGRADRAGGARAGLPVRTGDRRRCRARPAAGSTARATPASSSWSRTPTAACWSARPRRARGAARCSRCSPWRCTPGCPVETLRTMIYAYPTFHRGVQDALTDLG